MKEDKLVRLSLQFFGEPDEELDEDFGEYDEYDEYLDDEEELDEESEGEDAEEESEEEDSDGSDDEDAESGDGEEDDGQSEEQDAQKDGEEQEEDDTAELIAALKAAGYKGDDIKALTADVKKRSEDASKKDNAAERAAKNNEGKGHVKSGKPTKSATGDGMAGFTRRDIEEMKRAIGPNCTEERARRALEKRIRANAR